MFDCGRNEALGGELERNGPAISIGQAIGRVQTVTESGSDERANKEMDRPISMSLVSLMRRRFGRICGPWLDRE
jgi:hypothetical protein